MKPVMSAEIIGEPRGVLLTLAYMITRLVFVVLEGPARPLVRREAVPDRGLLLPAQALRCRFLGHSVPAVNHPGSARIAYPQSKFATPRVRPNEHAEEDG